MRRYIAMVAGLAFVLITVFAMAQAYPSSGQSNPSSSQTSSAQTSSSTASAGQKTVEGCVFKEESDYFLVPKSGNPIKLQAGTENLSMHEGHKVKVSGSETAISGASTSTETSGGTSGTAAGTSSTSSQTNPSSSGAIGSSTGSSQTGATGTSTGTGSDLHKLATQELTISNLQREADTCPVNWNSKVHTPSSTKQ